MRISQLSSQTGVTVATIKFYLRDGLLPAGQRTARNQAEYNEGHCRRLIVIRTLTEVMQLDLASTRRLLHAIDDHDLPLSELYQEIGLALYSDRSTFAHAEQLTEAYAEVNSFFEHVGWTIDAGAPGRHRLAQVIAAMRRLGCEPGVKFFTPYADVAERLAEQELDLLPDEIVGAERGAAVMRSMLLDVVLVTLRRLAHEHRVTMRSKTATP